MTGTGGGDGPVTVADLVAARSSLWSAPELAEILSVSAQFLYDLVKRDRIPSITLGASIRFDPKITADWLRERSR